MVADVDTRELVERHRDVLEAWAEHDIPFGREARQLLDEYGGGDE